MLHKGSRLRQYEIESVLGEGGFATTYLAFDASLGRKFAIKEYCPSEFSFRDGATVKIKAGSGENFEWGKERFIQEAKVLAKFNHVNIVGVNQIFEHNNTAYIVLEYQSGRSFHAWLKEIDTVPNQKELDFILKPLLSGLSAIHRNNILHRDIAPDNLYLRDDGSPVLLDFGSAKEAIASRTKAVSAIVKDGFSPPEQYSSRGSSQGPWTDIYALAATIYYALTGITPFGSTERLLDDQLTPLMKLSLKGFRPQFLSAIDWGLKLAPKDRPQSVEQWSEALFSDKLSEPAGYQPVIEDNYKPEGSSALMLTVLGILFLLPILALVYVFSPRSENYIANKMTSNPTAAPVTQANQSSTANVQVKLRFCNKLDQKVWVARSYQDDAKFQMVRGWLGIAPHDCSAYQTFQRENLWWYAELPKFGTMTTQATKEWCVHSTNAFDMLARDYCARGEEKKRFLKIIAVGSEVTIDVTN